MTRKLALTGFLGLAALCLGAHKGVAQTPCGSALTAQERIAKRDIQERIDESIDADIARDTKEGTRNLSEDFTLRLLDGTVLTRSQVLEGNEQQKSSLLMVSDRTRVKVDCLVLNGKEATVYTNQHYVRYMPDRKNGSPHEVITNITHRETWIFTSEGWKVKRVEELQEGQTLLDGQPYNP
jgi:hypothetical protein